MLSLLFNLTSEATNNDLSLIYQTLGFTFTNTSPTYAVCGSIIVLCMLATTLRNLIYKVLNLAVLSVFVVALWAYLTDVTFIYVVYILTFVSAVVMLFLSVVLMLPSSAIAVTKRNGTFTLLLAISAAENAPAYTTVGAQLAYFSLLLVTVLYLVYNENILSSNTIILSKLVWREVSDRLRSTRLIRSLRVDLPHFIGGVRFVCGKRSFSTMEKRMSRSRGVSRRNRYTLGVVVRDLPGAFEATWGIFTWFWFKVMPEVLRYELPYRLPRFLDSFVRRIAAWNTSLYAECGAQFFATLSIFFIAVPRGIPGYTSGLTYNGYFTELLLPGVSENLAAIQYGLYIGQPLLLIVSITGLLVALIGAPFFISRSN